MSHPDEVTSATLDGLEAGVFPRLKWPNWWDRLGAKGRPSDVFFNHPESKPAAWPSDIILDPSAQENHFLIITPKNKLVQCPSCLDVFTERMLRRVRNHDDNYVEFRAPEYDWWEEI